MATVRILLGLVCIAFMGSSWRAERSFIAQNKIVEIAQSEVGVQETAENSGLRVDQYNAYVGLKKVPWCASFVSWCYGQAGHSQPRTAWSPSLFPVNRITNEPLPGMVLGVYFPQLKRIAHCGIVEGVKNDLIYSIEGNTNVNGSREGDGVYRRIRHRRSINCYADWTGRK
jgi:hypothetical protein